MIRTGFLTVCLLLSVALASSAQVYVDGVAIDTLTTPYCQLIGINAGAFSRADITIDYGQRYISTGFNRQKVAGPDGKPVVFNSTIDALNFMVRQGWELVSSQVLSEKSGAESRFIYLLKRRNKYNGRE